MRLNQSLIPLCLALAAASASAAPKPGAVRVTLDGQTRVVRTIGQPADADFYAPLTQPLRSLWLDLQPRGSDRVEIRYQGKRVARWPVVTHVDELPAGAGEPVVLKQGEELLVPVRAFVELGEGKVDWDDRSRTLTITPTVRGLELKEGESGLEVKVEASAPVKVTSLQLSNPNRLVIDVTPAWFRMEDVPQPVGVVRTIRLGQFTKETARVVMELTGGPVRVTGLPQTAPSVMARVQTDAGTQVAQALEPGEGPATVITPRRAPARPPTGRASQRKLTVPRRGTLSSRSGLLRRDLDILRESGDGLLAGKVICIDPGHGGWKFGAQGQNGLKEGDACLAMGLQVARALQEAGATVLMTRDTDMHVGLPDRYNFANARGAHLFISIHCNAFPRRGAMSGTETYYCTPQSLGLAQALHPYIVGVMGGRDGGIRRRNFAVVRHTTMPSVLLEVGYIDNTKDEEKLGDPIFQEQVGDAVRDGVLAYFGVGG